MSLQHELHKRNPFDSPAQEAYLALVRTQSIFTSQAERFFKGHGLSQATYNALRILRGAGPHGRMCHEIGEHLVAQVPDVTRLVDRLEKSGLVQRARCAEDRRVIYVKITDAGLDLLKSLDAAVLELHQHQMGHMTADELTQLSALLAKARAPHLKACEEEAKRQTSAENGH